MLYGRILEDTHNDELGCVLNITLWMRMWTWQLESTYSRIPKVFILSELGPHSNDSLAQDLALVFKEKMPAMLVIEPRSSGLIACHWIDVKF
jgi:hypothetical protein